MTFTKLKIKCLFFSYKQTLLILLTTNKLYVGRISKLIQNTIRRLIKTLIFRRNILIYTYLYTEILKNDFRNLDTVTIFH